MTTYQRRDIKDIADEQYASASLKYDTHFTREFYEHAIEGKSAAYAKRLRNAALAICGSPYHSISSKARFNRPATLFLRYYAEHQDDSPAWLIGAEQEAADLADERETIESIWRG